MVKFLNILKYFMQKGYLYSIYLGDEFILQWILDVYRKITVSFLFLMENILLCWQWPKWYSYEIV